jgi:hypothetical protein
MLHALQENTFYLSHMKDIYEIVTSVFLFVKH